MMTRSLIIGLSVFVFAAGIGIGQFFSKSDKHPEIQTNDQAPDEQSHQTIQDVVPREEFDALQKKLALTQRDVAQQREMIREHTLDKKLPTLESLLGLFPLNFPRGRYDLNSGNANAADFRDCWFATIDGLRLHGWYLPHKQPQHVILFAHGNAGNLTNRTPIAVAKRLHRELNASVLIFDYRGYGRSEGLHSVKDLPIDARAARDFLADAEGVSADEIVLIGHSMGGGAVAQVAADDGARALILQSTYSSFHAAAKHYFKYGAAAVSKDLLNSSAAVARYHGPVLVCHGTADDILPFEQGKDLFTAANEPKTFISIPGGNHWGWWNDDYFRQLGQFLNTTEHEVSGNRP